MRQLLRAAPLWALTLSAVLFTGCAGHQRDNYLRDRAATVAYEQPLAQLWPQVKTLMDAHGYSWRELPNQYVLETEWLDSGGGTMGPTSSTRYLIEGLTLADGRAVLRALRTDRVQQQVAMGYATDKGNGGGMADSNAVGRSTTGVAPEQKASYRDLELELEFFRKLNPKGATALEAEASAKYP
ncbi:MULTISPECIES: hypothetical protein [Corallococcus]|uniref:Uncharacterized protein n=2 Tax=Corallococcus TaxID=83461 RepID=A0A7Y4JV04_9BACT|nr:hypothetical protein [Corallococcus exercitus]NOK11660.1 hypothetical protein [Corallococcus exercitus]GMU09610.1 hypothetical protein ASNO1_58640 [Corallococcus sp. NO1]